LPALDKSKDESVEEHSKKLDQRPKFFTNGFLDEGNISRDSGGELAGSSLIEPCNILLVRIDVNVLLVATLRECILVEV
jgi:hypothetical protein